jgi:hypothetical protein
MPLNDKDADYEDNLEELEEEDELEEEEIPLLESREELEAAVNLIDEEITVIGQFADSVHEFIGEAFPKVTSVTLENFRNRLLNLLGFELCARRDEIADAIVRLDKQDSESESNDSEAPKKKEKEN